MQISLLWISFINLALARLFLRIRRMIIAKQEKRLQDIYEDKVSKDWSYIENQKQK
jgi:hypothetical protein